MIRRTHIHWVDLDPAQGSEAAKRRPAVVVSNDRANATAENLGRGVITVVPLTTNTAHVFPFQVIVESDESGLARASKAQAEQCVRCRFGVWILNLSARSGWRLSPHSRTRCGCTSICSNLVLLGPGDRLDRRGAVAEDPTWSALPTRCLLPCRRGSESASDERQDDSAC